MKLTTVAAFVALISSSDAHDTFLNRRHANIAHKRQAPPGQQTTPTIPVPSGTPLSSVPASSPSSTVSANSSPAVAVPSNTVPGVPGAIPLNQITSGMPTGPTFPVSSTYPGGATPTYSGAPGLPSPFVFQTSEWPPQDVVVDPTMSQVQQWMQELNGHVIPDIPQTDGTCAGSPNSTANAQANGWWTCGGYTRPTDIATCPDKMTWGLSFDDGPSPYTQTLLNYLNQQSLQATFFVVGSRVIERPDILIEEYMAGHHISVHTWSHRPLTSLSNEQIVGELGFTRAAIKAALGVTPTTMRPPYGDIDDRVRAISLAMGMVPILWTSAPQSGPFDTNDWRVAGGLVTGSQSVATFEGILGNASTLNTGFIVLEHDLYEITVDLATQYTLNAALQHNPPFTLMSIGQCSKIPTNNLYRETNTNKTFPYPITSGSSTGGSTGSGSNSSHSNANANASSNSATSLNTPLGGLILIGLVSSFVIGSISML